MPRLTPLTVKKKQPKAERQEIADSVTSGLYFIVQPSGVKSWAVRYRFDRKPCKLTLGRYPAVELGEARDLAKSALEAVDKGTNPALREKLTRLARARSEPGAADAEAGIKAEDLTRDSPVRDVPVLGFIVRSEKMGSSGDKFLRKHPQLLCFERQMG
jgi:hypothetical protein